MKSVYAFIHYAFGGVKAPSISVLGSSTSATESARRFPPPRGSILAARLWASPSGSSSRSLFLIRGYTSCRGWPPADPFLGVRSPFFIGYFFCVQFVFSQGVWVPGQTDVPSRLRSTSSTAIVSSTSSLSRITSAESAVHRGGRTCFPTAVEYIAKSTFPYFFPFLVCVFADRMQLLIDFLSFQVAWSVARLVSSDLCCFTSQLSWSFCADVRLLATLSTVGWSVAGASVWAREHLVGPCTEHLVGFWSACPPSVCPAFGCPQNGFTLWLRWKDLLWTRGPVAFLCTSHRTLVDTRTGCP